VALAHTFKPTISHQMMHEAHPEVLGPYSIAMVNYMYIYVSKFNGTKMQAFSPLI